MAYDLDSRLDNAKLAEDQAFRRLHEMPDAEVIEHLTQVKGIGVWTAQMFLMFSLRRENVLPTGDFGVRIAMFKHYLDVQRPKRVAPK